MATPSTPNAPWYQGILAWAIKHPDRVLFGALLILIVGVGLSFLRQPTLTQERGDRVVGSAPTGAPMSQEELAKLGQAQLPGQLETALNTLAQENNKIPSQILLHRCERWQDEAIKVFNATRKSPITFYAEQSQLQSAQLMATNPGDTQLRLFRWMELAALNLASQGSCGGRAVPIATPLNIANQSDGAGSVAVAAGEFLVKARTLESQSPNAIASSIEELRNAAQPSQLPVVNVSKEGGDK